MRTRILTYVARISSRYPGRILLAAVIITAIMALFASRLELTMRWSDLMPQREPMVMEFNRILAQYSSASNIIVVIEGEYGEMAGFVEEIAAEISALESYVKNVKYRVEEEFIRDHGFILLKEKELRDVEVLLSDLALHPLITNINDNFEREYIEDESSLGTSEKEKSAVRHLDGLDYWIGTMTERGRPSRLTDCACGSAASIRRLTCWSAK